MSPSASSDIPSPTSYNDDVDAAARSGVETAASDYESLLAGSEADQKVELRDITARFPEGQLSVVTGPAASGKAALLVRRRVPPPSAFAHLGRRWYCLEMTQQGKIVMSKHTSKIDENGDMHTILTLLNVC